MGWKDVVHKAKVAAGVDEDKSVADEAAEELAKQAKDDKGGDK
jgi:hypothetical protein